MRKDSSCDHPSSESEAKLIAKKLVALGHHNTALIKAVSGSDLLLTKALLQAGADPNGRDAYGRTVLENAVATQDTKMVDLLLQQGADANATTVTSTPLLKAIEMEDWPMIQHLLKRAPGRRKDKYSGTLYVVVRHWRNPELISRLLKNGADPTLPGADGLTALDWAKANGDKEVEAMLRLTGLSKGRSRRSKH